MRNRHYSAWDVLAIVYSPAEPGMPMADWAASMRLTREARRWRRWSRIGAKVGLPGLPRMLWVGRWIIIATVLGASVAWVVWLDSTAAKQPGGPPATVPRSHIWAKFGGLGFAVGVEVWRSIRSFPGPALAARRAREDGLVRKARRGFAPGRPTSDPPRAELAKRQRAWETALRKPPPRSRWWRYCWGRPLYSMTAIVAQCGWLLALILGELMSVHSRLRLFEFTIAVLIIMMLYDLAYSRVFVARARRSLTESRCPDCAYDLRGARAEHLYDDQGPIDLGPRRCPECASPWPLIPPPFLPS